MASITLPAKQQKFIDAYNALTPEKKQEVLDAMHVPEWDPLRMEVAEQIEAENIPLF